MEVEINMLNVEDGDAIILRLKKGDKKKLILFDGGYSQFYKPILKKRIEEILPEHDNRIDLLIITHYDNDHIGAVEKLLDEHGEKVKEVWTFLARKPLQDTTILNEVLQHIIVNNNTVNQKHQFAKLLEMENWSKRDAELVLESLNKFRAIEEKLIQLKAQHGLIIQEPIIGLHLNEFPEFRVIAPSADLYNKLLPKIDNTINLSKEVKNNTNEKELFEECLKMRNLVFGKNRYNLPTR